MQPLPQDVQSQPDLRPALLEQVTTCFEHEQIPYSIVGDTRSLPDQIDSDVDMVVSQQRIHQIPALLARCCRSTQTRLVQVIPHEQTAYFCVLARQDHQGNLHFLQADICGDYYRQGKLFLTADELLAQRMEATDAAGRSKGFMVPAPAGEFMYYLLKKIDKQQLNDRQAHHLSRQWRQDPEGVNANLARFWPSAACQLIAAAAKQNNWHPVQARLPELQQALHQNLSFSFRAIFQEGKRLVNRVNTPTGLMLTLLGPDGSGKSTVGKKLLKDLAPAFWHTQYIHLRPEVGVSSNGRDNSPVVDPHGKPPRHWTTSLLKCLYYVFDYNAGYLCKIKPRLIQTSMVVFDRYYHDLLVDPARYRYGGPLPAAKACGNFLPYPDLFLILDAPAETLHQRKQEVPLEETIRQRQAYRRLAKRLPNSYLVDASQPLKKVVANTEGLILQHMAKRTAKRFGADVKNDD